VQHIQQDSAQKRWVGRLCPECALCCNGVLFADVRLLQKDCLLVLEEAGLKLNRVRGRIVFDQPCACLEGCLCSVYENRPSHCRGFNCHTLKQAQSGQINRANALKRIREAKEQVEEIRCLLRSLGNRDEHLALTKRYRAVMNQPIDLSCPQEADQRGQLMMAVNRLMNRLQRDFLR